MAVHQNTVSSVCQKEHRTFYAPFTRGKEQVYISFVATNILKIRTFILWILKFVRMALWTIYTNSFCSCFMNKAHWAENCVLVCSFSFKLFLWLIKTQEMCVFVWSGLSWKVWSTVRWAPLQTWSAFTESQNEKQRLGLRTQLLFQQHSYFLRAEERMTALKWGAPTEKNGSVIVCSVTLEKLKQFLILMAQWRQRKHFWRPLKYSRL